MNEQLIGRIKARIADDARRTGDGDHARMPADFRARARAGQPLPWQPLTAWMDDQAQACLAPLKPIEPLDEAAVAKVEKSLGFRLPEELRRLYLEIGDGGFGPFNGIRRLANWAKDRSKLVAELPSERGRDWPEALLPIVYRNGKRICVDRTTGAVLLWTKPPKRASEKKWLASFVPQSPSVAEWLERWVDTPTEVEGGPEGGWTPPGEESARRDAAAREKAERRAQALERAQRIHHADLMPLDPGLLARLRARAMDPGLRTRFPASEGRPVTLASLEEELEEAIPILPPSAMGLVGLFKAVRKLSAVAGPVELTQVGLGAGLGTTMRLPGASGPVGGRLREPATEAALAHAARKLGFPLPAPLVQLYRIADGGFGPGFGGLASLARMTELYLELTARGGDFWKPWPARRLPLYEEGTALGCLDLETGAIRVYEILGMDSPATRDWRRCDDEWSSIGEMMEHWLGSLPVGEERKRAAG